MNAVSYAIQRIMKQVPRSILEAAFISRLAVEEFTLDTLESRIYEEVFSERVSIDCNLTHTKQITIPLIDCERVTGGYYTATYRVPSHLTQGKKIVSVLHLTAAAGTFATASSQSMNASNVGSGGMYTSAVAMFNQTGGVFQAMSQAVNSVSPIQIVSNAMTYIVGYNTILIRDTVINPATMHLRVNIENDENMNNIGTPYYPRFFKLMLLATKMYIFNKLILEQDSVFIHSGGELNRFRDEVEKYADAEEQYEEFLPHWMKSALLNDNYGFSRHYSLRTGGGY